ncbi:MAG: 7-carboxy-7-deazaguanine synthase QueE [Phycisphaerae bacterium]
MKIAEIFSSIQGEGKLTGVPSVFIRTSGCNLRCIWCDTPYSSWRPVGKNMAVAEILKQVRLHQSRYLVITGGEPMLQPELPELIAGLRSAQRHITVETAGTRWLDVPMDLASISPKLSNSTPSSDATWSKTHERRRLNWEVLYQFASAPSIAARQWKFVLRTTEDIHEVDAILTRIARVTPVDASDVILMPEGVTLGAIQARTGWLAEICRQRGFRFGMRLHILLYGNTPGT